MISEDAGSGAATSRVAVVADSTVSLPQALLQEYPIHVVPLDLILQGRTYRDGLDLAPDDFYALLPQTDGPVTTSAPSPGAFLQAFQEAGAYASGVLCLTMTARLSSTFDSASTAAAMARETRPGLRIRVVDSGTAGGAEALIALAAARAARAGSDLEVVARAAQEVASRVHFLGVLETLHYVWKGGHIPKAALWATSLLRIKPVLDIREGEVRLVARPRSRAKALDRMLDGMAERAGPGFLHVNVMHAAALEEGKALAARIRERFPDRCQELFLSAFSPVIGAHTGPGLLAVAWWVG